MGVRSHFLSYESCGLNSGSRTSQQVPLLTGPSDQLPSPFTINISNICGAPALHHTVFSPLGSKIERHNRQGKLEEGKVYRSKGDKQSEKIKNIQNGGGMVTVLNGVVRNGLGGKSRGVRT